MKYSERNENMILLLYILSAIVAIILLMYVWLLIKRFAFIRKLKAAGIDNMKLKRPTPVSVLFPNGKEDIELSKGESKYSLTVITTPFRRVRYHFSDSEGTDKKLEVIAERKAMYVINKNVPSGSASLDRVTTIAKYSLNFDIESDSKSDSVSEIAGSVAPDVKAAERYVILYPAPRAASLAKTSHLILLGNGDELFDGIKICGLEYFIKNVLSTESPESVIDNITQSNF